MEDQNTPQIPQINQNTQLETLSTFQQQAQQRNKAQNPAPRSNALKPAQEPEEELSVDGGGEVNDDLSITDGGEEVNDDLSITDGGEEVDDDLSVADEDGEVEAYELDPPEDTPAEMHEHVKKLGGIYAKYGLSKEDAQNLYSELTAAGDENWRAMEEDTRKEWRETTLTKPYGSTPYARKAFKLEIAKVNSSGIIPKGLIQYLKASRHDTNPLVLDLYYNMSIALGKGTQSAPYQRGEAKDSSEKKPYNGLFSGLEKQLGVTIRP